MGFNSTNITSSTTNNSGIFMDYEDDFNEYYNEQYMKNIPNDDGKIVYLSIIFVVSLIINIALIVQQILKIRNPIEGQSVSMPYMLVTLGIANLISTFFTVLVHGIWFGVHWWYGGDFMCKIVLYFRSLEHFLRPFSVSGLLMAYVAERVTKQDGKKIAMFFMIPACVIGCLICMLSLPLTGTHKQWFADKYHCSLRMDAHHYILPMLYFLSAIFLGYVFPAVISAALCCASCCYIDRKDKPKKEIKTSSAIYIHTTEQALHDRVQLQPGQVTPVKIKPSYLPVIINIVFFVMYLKFLILTAITLSGGFRKLHLTRDHMIWMYFLGTSSVVVTAAIAFLGSLSKFPRIKCVSDFSFKKLTPDDYC